MQNSNQIVELQNKNTKLLNLYRKTQQLKLPYSELTIFQQKLKNRIPTLFSYNFYQRKVNYYRSIFLGIGLIFLILGLLMTVQNFIYVGIFLTDIRPFLKGFLTFFALFFSISAIALSYSLCVVKEATTNICLKARRQFLQIYRRKCIENGFENSFLLGFNKKYALLRSAYQSKLDALKEQKKETELLLDEVCRTNDKEVLFCQALLQLEERLNLEVQQFKKIVV